METVVVTNRFLPVKPVFPASVRDDFLFYINMLAPPLCHPSGNGGKLPGGARGNVYFVP
jgi:hypothetical protein